MKGYDGGIMWNVWEHLRLHYGLQSKELVRATDDNVTGMIECLNDDFWDWRLR